MPIAAPTTITKPAEPEKSFDVLRLRNFFSRTPENGQGTIYIETIPENSETGDTDQGTVVDDIREPLYELLANVPECAAVYAAFITGMNSALPAIRAYREQRDNPQETE